MTRLPYFIHKELLELLAEMDTLLLEGGTPPDIIYVLYVIDGAAIGEYLDGRLTQDVDVISESIPEAIMSAAKEVARNHNIADVWINNQATPALEDIALDADLFDTIYDKQVRLIVRAAKPDTLLALKLLSGRGKDVQDILDLAEFTGIAYYDSIMALCDSVFAQSPSYHHQRQWVSSIARDIHQLLADKRSGSDITSDVSSLVSEYEGQT